MLRQLVTRTRRRAPFRKRVGAVLQRGPGLRGGAFSATSIVQYFLVRKGADGLPADARNLDESFLLYSRSYVHDVRVLHGRRGEEDLHALQMQSSNEVRSLLAQGDVAAS